MLDNIFKTYFLIGVIAAYVLRVPYVRRNRQNIITEDRTTGLDGLVAILAFMGLTVIPAFYVLTPWLGFADYHLPTWAGVVGAAAFAVALWLLLRSYADLGRNWSNKLQIREGHSLVTQGVYHYIQHPIYASQWLWGIAQALLLHNWIAGLAGLAFFPPVYLYWVPREEQMMLDHFGEEYRLYMNRTGRVVPLLWR